MGDHLGTPGAAGDAGMGFDIDDSTRRVDSVQSGQPLHPSSRCIVLVSL